MHAKLSEFITTGELPPSSKARNLLLDLARAELSKTTHPHTPMITLFGKHKIDAEQLTNLADLAKASGVQSPLMHAASNAYRKASGLPPISSAPAPKAKGHTIVNRAALPTAQAATPAKPPTPPAAGIVGFTPVVKPTATKAAFDALTARDKMKFSVAGGKITA